MIYSDTVQQMENMVDGKTLKLADLDLEFIATKAQTATSKLNPERALVRHNWLEVFIRLCQTKYMKNGAGGPDVKSWGDCFERMIQVNVLPSFKKYDSHAWRKKNCWVEEVDLVLKHSLNYLKLIYQKNSGRFMEMGTNAKYMSIVEFMELLADANLFNEDFGVKQAGAMFNVAIMTQPEELENERFINMTFVEFLEAIVRVAEKLEIGHIIDVSRTICNVCRMPTRSQLLTLRQRGSGAEGHCTIRWSAFACSWLAGMRRLRRSGRNT